MFPVDNETYRKAVENVGIIDVSTATIRQICSLAAELERLADEINGGELIEDFVQGSQSMRRESPALRSYNTTIKSFTALSKSLLDLLPEKAQKQAGNELMGFITQPKAAGKP